MKYKHYTASCMVLVALTVLVFGLTACGSKSGRGGNPLTITGQAVKGPVSEGTVVAYAVAGGAKGAVLNTVVTDAGGNYNLSIDSYSGPVFLEITGGSYIDEATGVTVNLPTTPGLGLQAVVSNVSPGATLQAQITPLTTMAAALALSKAGGLSTANISASNQQIGAQFGLLDIINTQPINPLVSGSASGATQEAINYGLILGGLSQESKTLNLSNPIDLVTALSQDISDGTFNGQYGANPVMLNGSSMTASIGTTDLSTALNTFSNDTRRNVSGGTVSATLLTILQNTTMITTPAAPTGVTAVTGDGQVTVIWNPVSGADSYNVYIASHSGITKSNLSTLSGEMKHSGVNSPFIQTGLTNGTTYYFVVTAVNSSGEGIESSEVSSTPAISLTTSFEPSNLHATAVSNSQITLEWTDNSASEDGVKIERKTGATGTYSQIATVVADIKNYSDTTGLTANNVYCYRARAFNSVGDSGYSNESCTSVQPIYELSNPVAQFSFTDSAGQASFLTSEGRVVNFKVIDSTSKQPLANISLSFEENQNEIFITNVSDASKSYAPVINFSNIEPQLKLQSASRKFLSKSLSETILGLTAEAKDVLIEMIPFNYLPDIVQHNQGVQYLVKLNGTIEHVPYGALHDVSCMTVGEYIELKEKLIEGDENGIIIDAGMDLADIALDLSTEANILLKIAKGLLTPEMEGLTNTTIEYLCASEILCTSGTIETLPVDPLSQKIKVEYYIYNGGNTLITPVVLKPLKGNTCQGSTQRPAAPTGLSAMAVSSSQINLSWNDSLDESGYIIEYSNDGTNFKQISLSVDSNITSYSHKFLTPNTSYYYRIYALNENGSSEYSDIVQVVTFALTDMTAPSIPTGLVTSELSSSQISLSWNALFESDVAGYKIYRNGVYIRSVNSSSIFDTGLSPDMQYCYMVSAFDKVGNESEKSIQVCAITLSGSTGNFYLSFPLPNRDSSSAVINSVFDHSMDKAYCADGIIVAYSGDSVEYLIRKDSSCSDRTWNNPDYYSYSPRPANISNYNVDYSTLSYDGHPGYDYRTIDQSADGKINVLAAADGNVILLDCLDTTQKNCYGTIKIDHGNGYKTLYLHLSAHSVTKGQSVTRGQIIGKSGNTGSSGGPHLHFEVQKNNIPVDPYGWKGIGSDPYSTRATNIDLWTPPVANPYLSISTTSTGTWSANAIGNQGTIFYLKGSGFIPSTTAIRYITAPNGITKTEPISIDGNGDLNWCWPTGCASPGTYTIYLKDSTGVNSNSITETITLSSNCSTDPLAISGINPNTATKGTTAIFTLTGTGFQSGFTAKIINEVGTEYDVSSTQFISSTSVKVTVFMGSGTTTNTQQIKVINPDGQSAQISFTAQGG